MWTVAALAAFNLACNGTYTTGLLDPAADMGVKGVKVEDRTYTFRIDLDARRWCVDACVSTETVAEVSAQTIILANDKPTVVPVERLIRLNRESGSFFYAKKSGTFQELSQGTCTVAPFTGFPARRF